MRRGSTATQAVPRGPLFRLAALIAIVGLCGGQRLEAKRKDDVVVMKDGDRLTGEIRKLENGILYFKADYMLDPVKLDWARVDHLESQDRFNVLFASGRRMTGAIEEQASQGFVVQSGGTEIRDQAPQVVSINPVEENFLAQLTGSVDYGFNYTGGIDTVQSNLSGQINYAADLWRVQASGSSVFSHQSGARNSGRNDLDVLYLKSVTDQWFLASTASLLNSDQQDLILRTTGGGGVGRDFVRDGSAAVFALAGVVFSREQYSPTVGDQTRENAETLLQVQFNKSAFRKFQFNGTVALHPSLTMLGRVRLTAESSLKVEIFRNIFWKFSFYENYDNRPPVNAPKNDFGTGTSVGWTF